MNYWLAYILCLLAFLAELSSKAAEPLAHMFYACAFIWVIYHKKESEL